MNGIVLLNGVNVELFDNAYPSPFNYEGPCVVSVGFLLQIREVLHVADHLVECLEFHE